MITIHSVHEIWQTRGAYQNGVNMRRMLMELSPLGLPRHQQKTTLTTSMAVPSMRALIASITWDRLRTRSRKLYVRCMRAEAVSGGGGPS